MILIYKKVLWGAMHGAQQLKFGILPTPTQNMNNENSLHEITNCVQTHPIIDNSNHKRRKEGWGEWPPKKWPAYQAIC